jgi:uncharacterized protein with beta-barrel porin domain
LLRKCDIPNLGANCACGLLDEDRCPFRRQAIRPSDSLPVGPLGALQYTLVDVDGFSEQGSVLPLHIQSNWETSLRTDLGARASYTWHLGSVLVIPTPTVAWEHEYLYSNLAITGSSADFPGQSATLCGPAEGHDSAIVNAGAAF